MTYQSSFILIFPICAQFVSVYTFLFLFSPQNLLITLKLYRNYSSYYNIAPSPRGASGHQRFATGLDRIQVFTSDFLVLKRFRQSREARLFQTAQIQQGRSQHVLELGRELLLWVPKTIGWKKNKKHYTDPSRLNKQRTRPPFGRGKREEYVFFCIMINGFLCAGTCARERACVYLCLPKTHTNGIHGITLGLVRFLCIEKK